MSDRPFILEQNCTAFASSPPFAHLRGIVALESGMDIDPGKPLEPTRAEDVLFKLSDRLATTANARSVYGEPVHAYERTIVPVATFGYGLGATSGGRDGENVGGGAGGGGVGARPAGYIEISSAGARYVSISAFRNVVIAALAGIAAGLLLGRLRR
jgi:uncharacterized spore protein YtfJ